LEISHLSSISPFSSARVRLSLYPRAVSTPRSKGRRSFARDATVSRRGSTTRRSSRRDDPPLDGKTRVPIRADARFRATPIIFDFCPGRGVGVHCWAIWSTAVHTHTSARARAGARLAALLCQISRRRFSNLRQPASKDRERLARFQCVNR